MAVLKLTKIGNSEGVIIPKEILENLHLKAGDQVFATLAPDGVHLTPYDPEFESAMKAFDRTRRKYRNTFRELAK
ncbi:MAG: AbrB/MazE/SpoVT family DNA-binding domain-containing protein [Gammaproteobacteria bacterium]|jgi:putative addiction module antidote